MTIKASQAITFKQVLPEHIRESYPKFVEFLQVYYDYLSKENSPTWLIENLSDNLDLDLATDTFLLMLKNEIGINVPSEHMIDRRLFLKHIRDIYASKGSTQSIETLFQLVYGTPAKVSYPADQILRTSNGKWSKQISVRTGLVTGTVTGLAGRRVTGSVSGVSAIVDRVEFFTYKQYSVYEIFLDVSTITGTFLPSEHIVSDIGTYLIYPVFSSIRIINGGLDYSIGTKFIITNPVYNGIGGRCFIDAVGLYGEIKSIALTDFGVDIIPDQIPTILVSNIVVTGITIPFFTYTIDLTSEGDGSAIVEVSVGGMCHYKGDFTDSSGMLSNTNKLQDSHYYQIFSYVIESILPFNVFKDTMKLTHPSGYKMFGTWAKKDNVVGITGIVPSVTSTVTVFVDPGPQ